VYVLLLKEHKNHLESMHNKKRQFLDLIKRASELCSQPG